MAVSDATTEQLVNTQLYRVLRPMARPSHHLEKVIFSAAESILRYQTRLLALASGVVGVALLLMLDWFTDPSGLVGLGVLAGILLMPASLVLLILVLALMEYHGE